MIRLKAGRETAGESEGVAKFGNDATLGCDGDQILDAHDFRNGGGHFGSDAGGDVGDVRAQERIGFLLLADGHRDGRL